MSETPDSPETTPKTTGRGPGDRRTGYRPTKTEIEARVTEIYKLLIIGLARHDISRYVSEKTTWDMTERTLDRYIAKAHARFEEHAKVRRDRELGKSIARLNDLYSRTHRVQDYKTCLVAQRELNELLGLYAPKRMEHLGPEGGPPSFIALLPDRAKDMDEWSRQCKQEAAARQPAPTASTASGEA